MNKLFFELIRLSIGTGSSLSKDPTSEEWAILYKMAVKQSLIGVCFAGVRKYMQAVPKNNSASALPIKIYQQWLGAAVCIQQRNEQINHRCVEIEQNLLDSGYKSCILKGQGLADLYGDLSGMRQSGDIDIWAIGETEDIISWARKTNSLTFYDYHHADLSIYKDTEIELHYRPTLSRNLFRNARLQNWFKNEGRKHISYNEKLGFTVPDYVFNIVLVLNHNLWHLLYEGVGLRQVLDLYYVLKSIDNSNEDTKKKIRDEALRLIKYFRLQRFAAASMWILKEMFGLEEAYLIGNSDEKAGLFLLDEIMISGNFGKFDKRLNKNRYNSRINLMCSWLKHNFRLLKYYPADVLWTPFGILRISLWRRWHYSKDADLK